MSELENIVDALYERSDRITHEIFHRICDMEQIQKQKQRHKTEEAPIEELPEPVDEAELTESTKRVLADIAIALTE